MNETFVASADFEKIASIANHTFNLTFNTSEMTPENSANLLQYLNKTGTLAFKVGKFEDEEIYALPETKLSPKKNSQSKRLRNTLFVWHKQNGGSEEDFEDFYNKQMEIFINQVKNHLEP